MRKALFTLNVGEYAPEITAVTYPLLRHYAEKIGAEFRLITERCFPAWPVVYEKLQIYDLGAENDWNIYVDSDALVHPDMFDVTEHLPLDTVAHNGHDLAGTRWKYDRFFRRDHRHISSCNWFTIGSGICIDLWHPLDDLTPEEAASNISPVVSEINSECFDAGHLVDDYALSRNIAKFGLKFTTVRKVQERIQAGQPAEVKDKLPHYLWHAYTIPRAEKVRQMKEVIRAWGIESWLKSLPQPEMALTVSA